MTIGFDILLKNSPSIHAFKYYINMRI